MFMSKIFRIFLAVLILCMFGFGVYSHSDLSRLERGFTVIQSAEASDSDSAGNAESHTQPGCMGRVFTLVAKILASFLALILQFPIELALLFLGIICFFYFYGGDFVKEFLTEMEALSVN